MRKRFLVGAAIALIAAVGFASPAQAHETSWRGGTAQVSVFHGVPNTPVNVFVDHVETVKNFMPGTFAGPLTVRAGAHVVSITAATATNDHHPIIGPVVLRFAANGNYTIAAHLTPSGAPTASLFVNDTRRTPRGDGRLTVRHTAAAPAVDILAGGTRVIRALANPNQAELTLKAGTVNAAVTLAGTTAPVIGPADVTVARRTNTIVYAWGSAADGTLKLAVQTVPLKRGHGYGYGHGYGHDYDGRYEK